MAKLLTRDEIVLRQGERLLGFKCGRIETDVVDPVIDLVIDLINLYDNIFREDSLRRRAVEMVVKLAKANVWVLAFIFNNASKYASDQHIDDAFPYSPNSFEVLGMIREHDFYILHFLEEVIKNDWGIPRWAAVEALCVINSPAADEVLKKVILGNYPPRNLSHQDDLRIIERYRGIGFVEMVLHSLD